MPAPIHDTARRVQLLVSRELRVDLDRVVATAKLQQDLAADHIDIIGLAMDVEDQFGIVLTDEDVERLNDGTVADLVAMVRGATAPAEAA